MLCRLPLTYDHTLTFKKKKNSVLHFIQSWILIGGCIGGLSLGCEDETSSSMVSLGGTLGGMLGEGGMLGGMSGGMLGGMNEEGGMMGAMFWNDPGGMSGGTSGGTVGGMSGGQEGGETGGNQGGQEGGMSGGMEVSLPQVCTQLPAVMGSQFDTSARCRVENESLKIRHIRDNRCPDYIQAPDQRGGPEVRLESVVVTRTFGDSMSVQDQEGGVYSGLWVYSTSGQNFDDLAPGTLVNLTGSLIEFYTVTELVVQREGVEVVGETPPLEPIVIADSSRIADGGDWVEYLESVLLDVRSTTVSNTAPDCPQEFDMFVINQNLRLSKEVEFDYEPSRGDVIESAVGILHFSFDHQKLLIAQESDLQATWCGGRPDKCEAQECPVLEDDRETGEVIITEIQNNPRGEDDQREYVELYNPNSTPVSLDGWILQDCGAHQGQLSGQIQPQSYLVVARSTNRQENGGVEASLEMGDLFLPNGYGSVLLFNQEGTLIDQVRYAPGGEEGWPERRPGQSLELMEPASNNQLGSSWTYGQQSYGDGGDGSPGRPFER